MVIVFPVASWDVCSVFVGDDGIEVCHCRVYVGNWNGVVKGEKLVL